MILIASFHIYLNLLSLILLIFTPVPFLNLYSISTAWMLSTFDLSIGRLSVPAVFPFFSCFNILFSYFIFFVYVYYWFLFSEVILPFLYYFMFSFKYAPGLSFIYLFYSGTFPFKFRMMVYNTVISQKHMYIFLHINTTKMNICNVSTWKDFENKYSRGNYEVNKTLVSKKEVMNYYQFSLIIFRQNWNFLDDSLNYSR